MPCQHALPAGLASRPCHQALPPGLATGPWPPNAPTEAVPILSVGARRLTRQRARYGDQQGPEQHSQAPGASMGFVHWRALLAAAGVGRRPYCMCWPPLMAMLAPVTKAASCEHK